MLHFNFFPRYFVSNWHFCLKCHPQIAFRHETEVLQFRWNKVLVSTMRMFLFFSFNLYTQRASWTQHRQDKKMHLVKQWPSARQQMYAWSSSWTSHSIREQQGKLLKYLPDLQRARGQPGKFLQHPARLQAVKPAEVQQPGAQSRRSSRKAAFTIFTSLSTSYTST